MGGNSMKIIQMLFFLMFISGPTSCMIITDQQELETMAQKIEVSAQNAAKCAAIAMDCWFAADNFLMNAFNNEKAIEWFNYFIRLYKDLVAVKYHTPALEQRVVSAYTEIALAYHHLGRLEERDLNLAQAQGLLGIDRIDKYRNFKPTAVAYFVVDGYRHYISLEESQKNGAPIAEQQKHLKDTIDRFKKAIAISDSLRLEGFAKSQAFHGLGVVCEFWGKCRMERGDPEAAIHCHNAIINFEAAIALRRRILRQNHPLVARTFHKLARSYVLYAEASGHYEFIAKASKAYQQAMDTFELSDVPVLHTKRDELKKEWEDFKAKYQV